MWFVYGPPTMNPFGREEEVNALVRLMRAGQPVGLIGPRRIGKTSILLASLNKSSLPYVFISAEEFVKGERGFDFPNFLSAYIAKVTEALYSSSGHRLVLERAKGYLKQLRELLGAVKVTFNVPELSALIEVVLDKAEKGRELREEFARALELPEILAERLGVERVVIAVDEFQYLRFARQSVPEIFHVMRSKWQLQRRASYVISGSAIGMVREIVSSKDQPFYQFFYLMRITPFTREVSEEFLRRGFEAEGVKVSEDEIREIVDYVDGFPAWLNLVGLKVVVEGKPVKEVLRGLPKDENVVNAVEGDLRKLSPSARAVLKRLAELGGEARPKDLGDNVWAVNRALSQLMRYGIVEREDRGVYRVLDPMVVHYLRGE